MQFRTLGIPNEDCQTAAWRRGADPTLRQGGVIHVEGNMLVFIRRHYAVPRLRVCARTSYWCESQPLHYENVSAHVLFISRILQGPQYLATIPCSIPVLYFHAKTAATYSAHYLNIPPSCAQAFDSRHVRLTNPGSVNAGRAKLMYA